MNTRDLMDFDRSQLSIAARLLSTLHTDLDHTEKLGAKVCVELNTESGYVFLIDNNFNVAMLRGEVLEDWLRCPKCLNEGFKMDMTKCEKKCCQKLAQSLHVL